MGTRSPRDTVLALVEGVGSGRWAELAELYALDTDVRHPFARDASTHLRGRDALHEHFIHFAATGITIRAREPVLIHDTADPEVVVAEFVYEGTDGTSTPIEMAACFVWRVHDGLIVEARDYLDRPHPVNGDHT